MIGCTAGPAQKQSNGPLVPAPNRPSLRRIRVRQVTAALQEERYVCALPCLAEKAQGRRAAKLQTRARDVKLGRCKAWKGFRPRGACVRAIICLDYMENRITLYPSILQGSRRPATARELANAAEWAEREAKRLGRSAP
jgi:hypothetical protein